LIGRNSRQQSGHGSLAIPPQIYAIHLAGLCPQTAN